MRVLLLKNKTTPLDPYHEIFNQNGDCAEFLPLLNHGPISIDMTSSYLSSKEFLEEVKTFIITSQRAVEVFHACLEKIDLINPGAAIIIRSKIGYTVGPATEKILRDNGFKDVRGGAKAGNGSKLADIILKELVDSTETIVFFTGVVRKDIIPVKLRANNIDVKEVVIYQTEPKNEIAKDFVTICEKEVNWIVFFSPQGTENIVKMIKNTPLLTGSKIASIGPTTQDYLSENGINPHVVAEKPTASSLFEALQKFNL